MITLLFVCALIASVRTQYHRSPQPVYCQTHTDCTSQTELENPPFGKIFAICNRGRCSSLRLEQACTKVSDCGSHHTCGSNGKCIYGELGVSCNTNSLNCAPGYACDATSKKCVKGLTGVVCRSREECGFGNSCSSGLCKKGTVGTLDCRRDSQCVGNLRCLKKKITKIINGSVEVFTRYRCSRLANFRKTRFPFGFRRCTTNNQCINVVPSLDSLTCERGFCQPLALGQSCEIDFIYGNRQCDQFTACINGKCAYAREGDKCYSEIRGKNGQCPPGFQCTAPRDQGDGRPGICTKGVAGMKCRDGSECSRGLICGTSGTCTYTAQGQRCRSNFWCPAGLICSRYSKTCERRWKVPKAARYPWVKRSIYCRTRIDCPGWDSCKNGICLPETLGFACTGSHRALYPQSGGLTCVDGTDVEGTLGKPCSDSGTNGSCYIGLACVNSTCVRSFEGAPCGSDINCLRNQACSSRGRTKCITPKLGDACRTNFQCPKSLRCLKAFIGEEHIFGRCG